MTVGELQDLVDDPTILPCYDLPEGMSWDVSDVLKGNNIAFISDAGGLLFGYEAEGEWEVHFLFSNWFPGKVIKRDAAEMLQKMFTSYGARVIRGYPPRGNRAVRHMGNALGFKKLQLADVIDPFGRHCETYELRADHG